MMKMPLSPFMEMKARAIAAEHHLAQAVEVISDLKADIGDLKADAARLRKYVPGCDCPDPSTCWESCGTLGHHERFVAVAEETTA